ncbi:hypothetical protein Hanom_Chr00s000001g01593521 [Helianthus anomalus]
MGEDTLEFEAPKKELAEEREKFNAKKKGLSWRVADAEDKLSKEKQFNADRQKEWETACERTNREMKVSRDEIVKLKGEKTKLSDENEQECVLYQKRESKYIQRIAKLEKITSEKAAGSKASEILAEEATADCKWLLARGIPLIANRIVKSDELDKYMYQLGEAAYDNGRKDGYGEGRAAVVANEKVDHFDLYKTDCAARYASKRQEYEFLEFAIVKAVGNLSRKTDVVEVLKKALGDQDPKARGAGSSHQDNFGLHAVYCPAGLVTKTILSFDRFNKLLCFDDPVVLSLGGLQCSFYHVYDAFVCKWARSSNLTGSLWLCVPDPTVHLVVTSLGGLQCFLSLGHWCFRLCSK